MKSIIAVVALVLSTHAFAEQVICHAEKAIQPGMEMKADAEISFDLNRDTSTLTNIQGHNFVQTPYAEANEEINIENSYMGFFQATSLVATPDYRPFVYKGWTQFKGFNAVHTARSETGMWGDFVLNLKGSLKKDNKFEARYIFQAGEHMGGTILLKCRTR
ncbi:MAG: hypothetical protein H7336_13935 [Bacteriovorax sp.]|nr:hypothetical protein [Bacteriovorax sp.]